MRMTLQTLNRRVCFGMRHWLAFSLVLPLLSGLTGCKGDHVTVDHKSAGTPQYEYRLDELALLQMAADDVQDLEQKKLYGKIYDDFASKNLKANTNRRLFLIMSNCAEAQLGGIEEIEKNDHGFTRRADGKQTIDTLRRDVHREKAKLQEEMTFINDGVNFKLNSLNWLSQDKAFRQCIADSAKLEARTAPKTENPEQVASGETLPGNSSKTENDKLSQERTSSKRLQDNPNSPDPATHPSSEEKTASKADNQPPPATEATTSREQAKTSRDLGENHPSTQKESTPPPTSSSISPSERRQNQGNTEPTPTAAPQHRYSAKNTGSSDSSEKETTQPRKKRYRPTEASKADLDAAAIRETPLRGPAVIPVKSSPPNSGNSKPPVPGQG